MSTKRFPSQRMLLWFMVPYLSTLLIALLLGITLYRTSVAALGNQWNERNVDLLAQDMERMNKLMSVFDEASIHMNQYNVYSLGNRSNPFEGASVMQVLRVQKLLKQMENLNQAPVWQSFLIFQKNGLVVSADEAYTLEEQYNHFLRPDGMSLEDWEGLLFSNSALWRKWLAVSSFSYTPSGSILMGSQLNAQKEALAFSRTLPGKYSGNALLLFLVDRNAFEGMFSTIQPKESTLVIQDEQGEILCVLGDPANWEQVFGLIEAQGSLIPALKESGLNYIQSGKRDGQWDYLLIQSRAAIDDALAPYMRLLRNILLGYLAMGIIISILLSYRMARPWETVLAKMRGRMESEGNQSGNSMNELLYAVNRLVMDSERMATRMEALKPQFEQLFARSLLEGSAVGALLEIGKHIGINPTQQAYGLCALISRASDRIPLKHLTRLELSDLRGRLIILPESGLLLLLLIYPEGPGVEADYQADLKEIGMLEQLDCAIGASELALSSSEARLIKERASERAYRRVWNAQQWEDGGQGDKGEQLATLLKQIQVYIIAGEQHKVRTALHQMTSFLNQEMAKGRIITLDHLCEVWIEYKRCAALTGEETELANPLDALVRPDATPHDFGAPLKRLLDQFEAMGEEGHFRRQNAASNQQKKLLQFVDEHYMDPNLSLNMLSSYMGMSPSLCSQQFKLADPRGFFDYLEDLRIQQAGEMLKNEDLAVEQIAMAVGYRSLSSFSRAFKRKIGISATLYRKQGLANEEIKV